MIRSLGARIGAMRMPLVVNVAEGTGENRNAVASRMELGGAEVLLLLEADAERSDARSLLQAGVGAVVGAMASAPVSSRQRWMEDALRQANRAVFDASSRNPALHGRLVSATVAVVDGETVHVASCGANAVYLRSGGRTETVAECENVLHRLATSGLDTGRGGAEIDGSLRRPVSGLGLAPDLFEVRQTATRKLADGAEVVLCGAAVMHHVTSAHLDSVPSKGTTYNTASRLYRFVESRLTAPSAVLAARYSGARRPEELSEGVVVERVRQPGSRLGLVLLVLALAAVLAGVFVLFGVDWQPGAEKPKALPPDLRLVPKTETSIPDVTAQLTEPAAAAAQQQSALADVVESGEELRGEELRGVGAGRDR